MDGLTVNVSTADYPQLEGVKEGDKVSLKAGSAVVSAVDANGVTLDLGEVEINTETPVDREYRQQRKSTNSPMGEGGNMMPGAGEDF